MIPVSACLASAIEDAAGVRMDSMPISPPELWAKLGKAAGTREAAG